MTEQVAGWQAGRCENTKAMKRRHEGRQSSTLNGSSIHMLSPHQLYSFAVCRTLPGRIDLLCRCAVGDKSKYCERYLLGCPGSKRCGLHRWLRSLASSLPQRLDQDPHPSTVAEVYLAETSRKKLVHGNSTVKLYLSGHECFTSSSPTDAHGNWFTCNLSAVCSTYPISGPQLKLGEGEEVGHGHVRDT